MHIKQMCIIHVYIHIIYMHIISIHPHLLHNKVTLPVTTYLELQIEELFVWVVVDLLLQFLVALVLL